MSIRFITTDLDLGAIGKGNDDKKSKHAWFATIARKRLRCSDEAAK